MEVRQYIRPDVTVSAMVHLSLVAFVMYTGITPLHPVVEKAIPVDVVVEEKKLAPEEKKPPDPQPSPELSMPEKKAALPSANSPSAPTTSQLPSPASSAADRETTPQPQPQAAAPAAPSTPSPSPARAYRSPEPDLTLKYHVRLGLPEDISPSPSPPAGDKHGDTGPASDKLGPIVDTLRRHLKNCSKLPAALSPSDNVAVKLRVQLTPNGRLATEPTLLEGTASMKGVQLMQGAIAALSACQPYAMLPAERYGEWKVLDLSFTPHDFNS